MNTLENLFLLILAVRDAGASRSCISSNFLLIFFKCALNVIIFNCAIHHLYVCKNHSIFMSLCKLYFCFAALCMIVLKSSPQQNGHIPNRFIQKPFCWVNPIIQFPALDIVFVDSPRASQRLSTPCLSYKPRAPMWSTNLGPKSTPTHIGHILVRVTAFTPAGCWQLSFFPPKAHLSGAMDQSLSFDFNLRHIRRCVAVVCLKLEGHNINVHMLKVLPLHPSRWAVTWGEECSKTWGESKACQPTCRGPSCWARLPGLHVKVKGTSFFSQGMFKCSNSLMVRWSST